MMIGFFVALTIAGCFWLLTVWLLWIEAEVEHRAVEGKERLVKVSEWLHQEWLHQILEMNNAHH